MTGEFVRLTCGRKKYEGEKSFRLIYLQLDYSTQLPSLNTKMYEGVTSLDAEKVGHFRNINGVVYRINNPPEGRNKKGAWTNRHSLPQRHYV